MKAKTQKTKTRKITRAPRALRIGNLVQITQCPSELINRGYHPEVFGSVGKISAVRGAAIEVTITRCDDYPELCGGIIDMSAGYLKPVT
jgi:ribosomal protein L21E